MIFVFASLLKARAQSFGPGECTRARDHYADLNDHLLADRQDDSDVAPDVEQRRTTDLTGFVTQTILARLGDIGDAGAIRAYLSCMQGDDVERERTNTPQVLFTKPGTVPLALTAMLLTRGGSAIPNTLALVQCFVESGGKWTRVGTGNEQGFDMHGLDVQELRSPIRDESWYLLSGKVNGQSGAVRLEVVSCGATQIRTVWQRDDVLGGKIEVTDRNTVSLTYSKQEDERSAAINGDKLGPEMFIEDDSGDRKRFFETLHVTPNGLEH